MTISDILHIYIYIFHIFFHIYEIYMYIVCVHVLIYLCVLYVILGKCKIMTHNVFFQHP